MTFGWKVLWGNQETVYMTDGLKSTLSLVHSKERQPQNHV